MIDTEVAINYLQQLVDTFKQKQSELTEQSKLLKEGEKKLLTDRAALIEQKSAFHEQTATMTAQVQRAEKLYDLAQKMKLKNDEEAEENKLERKRLTDLKKKLDDKEKEISDLEVLRAEVLADRERLDERELGVKKREDLAEKNIVAAREKSEQFDLKLKAVEKERERLQQLVEAHKL